MREENIEKMNFKELRAEVQLLRDELAIFKRKHEDAIYNLDSDNFGKSFTVEQNNMKAQIKITADAIKTMVSDTDLAAELEKYSTIEQTAEQIELAVVRIDSSTDSKISSKISQSADEIYLTVSQEYETKDDAQDAYDDLDSSISKISVKANGISTRVTNLETFKTSVFTQTEYGFTLDGDSTTFTGVIFLTDNDGNKRFEMFHDESQGYEQVFISSYGSSGLPIHIGRSNDVIYFDSCKQIVWGNNAPVAVFG